MSCAAPPTCTWPPGERLRSEDSAPDAGRGRTSELDRIGLRFVGAVDEAECGLLSAGFFEPARLLAACREHDVGYDHFADPNHRALYVVIVPFPLFPERTVGDNSQQDVASTEVPVDGGGVRKGVEIRRERLHE